MANRGAAYDAGKSYYNTLDGQTVAVDAASGKEAWRAKMPEMGVGDRDARDIAAYLYTLR